MTVDETARAMVNVNKYIATCMGITTSSVAIGK